MSDSDDARAPKSAFNSADPPRNFTLSVNDRIRAIAIGAPAYATRKKHLEDLEERHVRMLVTLHDALVAKHGQRPDREELVTRALHDRAATIDVKRMNQLVEAHNRYYPIEANLPCDLRTGHYLVYGRRWVPEEPWSAARLVERARAVIADRDDR
ncbi:MAG: hypothetical protein JWP87_1769 [Labilithrix sp.]|nr:hypothetical protein [Labilithrix sp.]